MADSIPTVSAVIPTYNREAFLRDAIRSACEQTFSNIEIVVVDDGSGDGSCDVVRTLGDSRIRYFYRDHAGVSAARNFGVSKSKAPFIAFLDSDDLWLPDKVEAQLGFFESNGDVSICQSEEIWMRYGRRVNPMAKHRKHSGWIFDECLPLCVVSPSAVMMRREAFELLGGFDESLPACEDYDLWLRASLRFEIHTLRRALTVKRGGHADQLSNSRGLDRYRIRALEKILSDPLLASGQRVKVLDEISRRSRIVADGAMKRGRDDMFEEYEVKHKEARSALSSIMNAYDGHGAERGVESPAVDERAGDPVHRLADVVE